MNPEMDIRGCLFINFFLALQVDDCYHVGSFIFSYFCSINRRFYSYFFQYSMNVQTEETRRGIQFTQMDDPSIPEIKRIDKGHSRKRNQKEKPGKQPISQKKKKGTDNAKLKQIQALIMRRKKESFQNNYLYKLRLNSQLREVPSYYNENEVQSEEQGCSKACLGKLKEKKGLMIGNIGLTAWNTFIMLHSTLMVFIFSIMVAFSETLKDEIFWYIRLGSFGVYAFDIILNCLIERYEGGNLLKNIYQIIQFYVENYSILDISSLLIYLLDIVVPINLSSLGLIVSIVRLFASLKKIEKLEYLYISSSEREQYYSLFKIILTNFAIGHVLSILLNLMAGVSPQESWWTKINISSHPWSSKYIWGYYWGTNIMLTVGFGDLAANNVYEALILVFIETFSCITLAYNISSVGSLIGEIKQSEEQKKKKLRFFHRMCQENDITKELESKISNYIDQSYQIKEGFSYDQYDEVVESLPKSMQIEYRKQANKALFDGIGFFNCLSKRTLLAMAELVERKICHPNEVILKKGDHSEFIILEKGKLSFSCNVDKKNKLDKKIMDSISVDQKEKAKLLSLDFIKNKILNYDITSKDYSVLYTLSEQKIKQALKSSRIDYEFFCSLRDRSQLIMNELQIHPCELCKKKNHSKFECPNMHFCPLRQIVIFRDLEKAKKQKSKRIRLIREKYYFSCLNLPKYCPDMEKFERESLTQWLEEYETELSKTDKRSFKQVSLNEIDLRRNRGQGTQIAEKIEKFFNYNMMEKNFWDLEIDIAHNFLSYFRQHNPDNFLKRKINKNRPSCLL